MIYLFIICMTLPSFSKWTCNPSGVDPSRNNELLIFIILLVCYIYHDNYLVMFE